MAEPEPSAAVRRIDLADLDATAALAGRIARIARPGDVIALAGPLGSGKTAFARAYVTALARQRGVDEDEVPSPTFTLVQTYSFDDFVVYHFDLYRIARPDEAWELGIEDAFADGVALIEWPDRLGPLLPADRLDIDLAAGSTPDSRVARLAPHGRWAARLGRALADG